MRIAAVGVYSDDGQVFSDKVFATECLSRPLLDLVFRRSAIAGATADLLEAGWNNGVDGIARAKMTGDLFFRPCGFKARYKIARADNFLAKAADQLNGSCINKAD